MTLTVDKEIWILEDDKGCQFVYEQTLNHRYKVRYFTKIADFEESLTKTENTPALIIADLMLDDGNFMSHLNKSKDSKLMVIPFIIVSSIDDIDALRFCFMEGALDYLTKPFKKNELIVKIENILSGASMRTANTVQAHKMMNLDGHEIESLTSKQKQLLSLFLSSPGRMISRDDILEQVWGDTSVHPKTIDVHLYNLRRKLNEYGYIIRSEGGGKWSLISDKISA